MSRKKKHKHWPSQKREEKFVADIDKDVTVPSFYARVMKHKKQASSAKAYTIRCENDEAARWLARHGKTNKCKATSTKKQT